MHTRLLIFLVFAVAVFLPATAFAQSRLDLDLNLGSYHLESWARNSLSQFNPGLGVEYHFNRTWSVMGGEYRNSYRRPTWYALGAWTPLHLGNDDGWHANAGLVAGLASGYTHRENHFAPWVAGFKVAVFTPHHWGVNFLAVPNSGSHNSGFVGFQLAIPLGGER